MKISNHSRLKKGTIYRVFQQSRNKILKSLSSHAVQVTFGLMNSEMIENYSKKKKKMLQITSKSKLVPTNTDTSSMANPRNCTRSGNSNWIANWISNNETNKKKSNYNSGGFAARIHGWAGNWADFFSVCWNWTCLVEFTMLRKQINTQTHVSGKPRGAQLRW